ncbi:hypothetical protein GGF49_005899 [Coemansia sp. RSA 1853]|nr:hypothetical protein LPJ76_005690 [Coemansia sp. RSA 638]KAJ2538459.1 hypothetical protein GGF49_005899 [Coemansia sp. RSA 1853]
MKLLLLYIVAVCAANQVQGLAIRQYPGGSFEDEDPEIPDPTPTPPPTPTPTPTPKPEITSRSSTSSRPSTTPTPPSTKAEVSQPANTPDNNSNLQNSQAADNNQELPYPSAPDTDLSLPYPGAPAGEGDFSEDTSLFPGYPDDPLVSTNADGDEIIIESSRTHSGLANTDSEEDQSETGSNTDRDDNNASKDSELDNSEYSDLADSDSSSDSEAAAASNVGRSNRGLQVGLGVGLTALLLILLGLLMFFFVRHKRQSRLKMHEEIADISGAGEQPDPSRTNFDQILVPDSAHPDNMRQDSYQINLALPGTPAGYLEKPSAEPRPLKDMPPQYHELPENRYAQEKLKEDD